MTDKPARAERQEAEVVAPAAGTGADIIYLPDDRQRPAEQKQKAKSGSNKRKRVHVEQFRTDADEHKALHERLRERGLSLGEFVMQLAKIRGGKDARRRRRGMTTEDREALAQAAVALNRVGNNQNQIARALNEFLLVAHEQSNARLENMLLEPLAAISGLPAMFAGPTAALLAVLTRGGDDDDPSPASSAGQADGRGA